MTKICLPQEDAEMQFFRNCIGNINGWAINSSKILGLKSAVAISAIMLDQERFNMKPSPGQ